MPSITPPDHPDVDPKWVKLISKIASHPKNRNLILLPEEHKLLTSKLRDLTTQLVEMMGFVSKYAPLMKMLSEVGERVNAGREDGQPGAGVADEVSPPGADAEADVRLDTDRPEHREGDGGGQEGVRDSDEPGGLRTVPRPDRV